VIGPDDFADRAALEASFATHGMTAMKPLFDGGIYAFLASFDPRVLQFKPPLTVTDDDVETIIDIVCDTFV